MSFRVVSQSWMDRNLHLSTSVSSVVEKKEQVSLGFIGNVGCECADVRMMRWSLYELNRAIQKRPSSYTTQHKVGLSSSLNRRLRQTQIWKIVKRSWTIERFLWKTMLKWKKLDWLQLNRWAFNLSCTDKKEKYTFNDSNNVNGEWVHSQSLEYLSINEVNALKARELFLMALIMYFINKLSLKMR